MTDYPIIDQRSLPKAQRSGWKGIGPRSRAASELPLPNAHEAVVYKSGGSYVIDDGRSRTVDDHIVNATNISVVDMREDAPVPVHVPIPSAGAAEFTVHVTFLCTVKKPEEVVEAGLKDMTEPLRQYVIRHQPLFHIGEEYEFDQISTVRRNVTAEIKAYVSVRPPRFRGMDVKLGNVQVLTPEELAEFHRKLRERELEGRLTSEEQRMDHVLTEQRQELEEIRRRHEEERELQRREHEQATDKMRREYDRRLEEQQLMHDQLLGAAKFQHDQRLQSAEFEQDQRLRSAKFEHAITETEKLKDAIGADSSEIPTLLAASAGERNMAEMAELLSQDRQRRHDEEAANELRRETWAHEDALYERQVARDDVRWQYNVRVEELKAQLEVLKAGVARGLADHQTIDKLMGVINGAVKQLENASAGADQATAGRRPRSMAAATLRPRRRRKPARTARQRQMTPSSTPGSSRTNQTRASTTTIQAVRGSGRKILAAEDADVGRGDEFHQANAGVSGDQGHGPGERGHGPWYADGAEVTDGHIVTDSHTSGNGTVPPAANGSAASQAPLLGEAAQIIAVLGQEFPYVAKPAHGPARWMRVLTGVDEKLLDRVWEERPRYTGLGAIVLGTAIMAMLSMLDALDQVFGPVWLPLLLVALFWCAFICSFDRWLISSTHGVRGRRLRIFLPRIGLALLFGVIIATPLVLTVFGSEVVSKAQTDQNNAVLAYQSKLKMCNPLPGQPGQAVAQSARCDGFRLSVSDPVIGTNNAIAHEKSQLAQLTRTINTDNNTIASDNLTARKECNGTHGTGLSGIVGQGPNCDRDRQVADTFARQSRVSQLETQASNLSQEIAQQTAAAGQQTQAYATAITQAIGKLVEKKQADEGRIGLLNRISALGELASSSPVVAGGTVLLGLFIITVDCLPVLSKMMSGATKYDELVESRLKTAEILAAAGMKVREKQATGKDEIALRTIESEVRARLEKIDDASRIDKAKRDAQLDRRIAELAAEFRQLAEEEDGASG